MSPVPTLSTYQNPLQTNITAGKYGYSLSEDQNNATCFRGILSSNISTLITNQYNANTNTSLLWSQPATLKNTSTANTNGYYYHSFTTTSNANNTVTLPDTNPTGTGQKVVVVDGGNIQINKNIDYAGTDKTLVLIARKNANGTAGGNIYINPSVTRIDAILIADGSLINATTSNASTTTSATITKNWIDNEADLSNRLIINGRIYSFNTRGGSLTNDLKAISGNTGRYFDFGTLKTDGTPSMSASMDLE